MFSGFSCTNIVFFELGLALGELRCATCGFEAVLNRYYYLFPCIFKAFRVLS